MTSGHEYLPDQLKGAFSPIMHHMHKKSSHHFIFHERVISIICVPKTKFHEFTAAFMIYIVLLRAGGEGTKFYKQKYCGV